MRKLLIISALLCTSAHAQFRTGNQLLSDMQEPIGYRTGLALGYVMGVTEAGNGVNFCLPGTVTAGQVSDMVKNRLISSPSVRHFSADIIIGAVLEATWPCAKKGQSL